MLNENARGSRAGAGTHNLFDLFVDQVIVYAVGSGEDTIARVGGAPFWVDGGGAGTAQGLCKAAAQAEVAEFGIRELVGAHRLVDAEGVLIVDDLILHQLGKQPIVAGQALERFLIPQEVDAAVAYVGIDHSVAVPVGMATKGCHRHGGCQVVGAGPLRSIRTDALICILDEMLKNATEIGCLASFEEAVYFAPLLSLAEDLPPCRNVACAAVWDAISPAALPPTPSKTATSPVGLS